MNWNITLSFFHFLQELAARERVIAEREALLAERDKLEAKKIRSSHTAARDIVRLSQQINTLEDSIRLRHGAEEGGGVRGRGLGTGGSRGNKEEIAKLTRERLVVKIHVLASTCMSAFSLTG